MAAKKPKPQNRRRSGGKGRAADRDGSGRFLPGQSGNPGGRPKEYRDFVELCREVGSPAAFAALIRELGCKDERARVTAALGILAYAWGRPRQAIELTGKDGGPVEVNDARARLAALLERRLEAMEKPASSKE